MSEVLGIPWWYENEQKHFGCRGTGLIYKEFYQWVNTTSYRCTYQDWPWDYFVFDNKEDERLLEEKYGQYMYKYQDED